MNPIPIKPNLIILAGVILSIAIACVDTNLPKPKRTSFVLEPTVVVNSPPKIITRPSQLKVSPAAKELNISPTNTDQQLSKTVVHIIAAKLSSEGSSIDLRINNIAMQTVDSTTGVVIDNDDNLVLCDFSSVNIFDRSGNKRYDSLYIITNRNPSEPQVEYEAVLLTANIEKDLAILKFSRLEDQSLPALPQADISATAPWDANHIVRIFGFAGTPSQPLIKFEIPMVDLLNKNFESIALLEYQSDKPNDKFPEFIKLSKAPGALKSGILFSDKGTLIGILTTADPYLSPTPILGKTIDTITVGFTNTEASTGLEEPYRTHFTPLETADHSAPFVSAPLFGSVQKINPAGRQLAGIEEYFTTPQEIHYEYLTSRLDQPTELTEMWFYEGQLVERLSQSLLIQPDSTYWHGGSLTARLATDALDLIPKQVTSGQSQSLPEGIWQLRVSIDGIEKSAASFIVSSEIMEKSTVSMEDNAPTEVLPVLDGFRWGTEVDREGVVIGSFRANNDKILLGFNYNGFQNGQVFGWRVYYGPDLVYSSREIPWVFGQAGVFWIGYIPNEPIWAGWWEFEIYINGEIITQTGRTAQVPE